MAGAAALWAAFLLPPQLVAWADSDVPARIASLADAGVYEALMALGSRVGLSDPYFLFGAGVAPSFLLIGLALYRSTRRLGWTGLLVSGLTLSGTVLVVISYFAVDWEQPWRMLWGIEGPLLLLIGIAGAAAGVVAFRRRWPRRWAVLLTATPAVIVASTLAIPYYPHGTLIGFGAQVAVLSWASGPNVVGPGQPVSMMRIMFPAGSRKAQSRIP